MNFYPIHEAVLSADVEAVTSLIKAGVPLDGLDKYGNTPLHWAVFGGYDAIVKALLEARANPNVFSSDGVTPKWRARDFGLVEIELLLTQYGGRIDTNENFNRNAFQVFNEVVGAPLPKEERQAETSGFFKTLWQNLKRWRYGK